MSKKRVHAPSPAPSTDALYAELYQLDRGKKYEKCVKTCNRILDLDPNDSLALHCKVVANLHLANFDVALKLIEEKSNKLDNVSFEHAYALYRLNRSSEALDVINKASKSSLKLKELKAQVLYKLEDYEESYSIFLELMKETSDDLDVERSVNLAASAVYVDDKKKRGAVTKQMQSLFASNSSSSSGYELLFNKACYELKKKEYSKAEETLKTSLRQCEKMLKEEMDDEEMDEEQLEEETAAIRVQLAFALQQQQRAKEALSIYQSVLKSRPEEDKALVAVASNNIVVLNGSQNLFDSRKRVKAALSLIDNPKLIKEQKNAIKRNNALLVMYSNQLEVCLKILDDEDSLNFLDDKEKKLITAAALSRVNKIEEAIDLLVNENTKLKMASEDVIMFTLVACQILLEQKNVERTLSLLMKLPEEQRYRFGILATIVALYLAKEERPKGAKMLRDAAAFHNTNKTSNINMVHVVLRKTAEFHLREEDEPKVAAQALQQLLDDHSSEDNECVLLAQLVLAYARFDLKKAMETSRKLPKVKEQTAIDVEALENSTAFGLKFLKKPTTTLSRLSSPKSGDQSVILRQKKSAKKRRSKRKLPKNYNPRVDPDPERWLPRRERTGYRKPRKDRRKGEKFTGAQGTAGSQGASSAEAFDYSQKQASNSGALPKSPAVESGPRQQGRKQQQKKKGKGSKSRF